MLKMLLRNVICLTDPLYLSPAISLVHRLLLLINYTNSPIIAFYKIFEPTIHQGIYVKLTKQLLNFNYKSQLVHKINNMLHNINM